LRNLPGRCHELTGNRKGQISIDLEGPYRLLFEVADNPIPQKEDGGLKWSDVHTIRILGIEDTHG
jgi:proteic killer suppression protein